MADAAGNTSMPSEKSPEVNFGVFLVICGILVVLLLLVFLLYQIQQGRHRKRRRKIKAEKYPETTETIPDNKRSKHCQYHFMKDVGLERKPGIADTASGLGNTA